MTRGKKIAVWSGVFLLVGLVAAGLAVGAAYENSPFKKGPDYFLERMDQKVGELNLTPAQKEKFEELKTGMRQSMESGREEGRSIFNKLKAEMNKDNPDMSQVASLVKAQMTHIQGRVGQGIDRMVEFYGVLDETQKAHVLAKAREHMDKPPCQGHPGPWNKKSD